MDFQPRFYLLGGEAHWMPSIIVALAAFFVLTCVSSCPQGPHLLLAGLTERRTTSHLGSPSIQRTLSLPLQLGVRSFVLTWSPNPGNSLTNKGQLLLILSWRCFILLTSRAQPPCSIIYMTFYAPLDRQPHGYPVWQTKGRLDSNPYSSLQELGVLVQWTTCQMV